MLEDHGLTLAMEEIEVVLSIRKSVSNVEHLHVNKEMIQTKSSIKYLGMFLETKLETDKVSL